MSSHKVRSLLRAGRAFAGICLLLTACDQWALFINSDGVLSITIVSDGYVPGRFRVRTRQADGFSRIVDVPSSGSLTLGAFKTGELELTLLAPEGCRVAAPNPRMVMANADETVNVAFDVRC
jgi:hypothetical protein